VSRSVKWAGPIADRGVVGRDRFGRYTGQTQSERHDRAGPVLTGMTVHHDATRRRGRDRFDPGREQVGIKVQADDVVLPGAQRRIPRIARPAHWPVAVQRFTGERRRVVLALRRRPDIDDPTQPGLPHDVDTTSGQPGQIVGSDQRPGRDPPSVGGRQSTKITDVEAVGPL
jgi:hypothetical protein